ncbi:MAG: sporulation integral membrane protein YtvI [Clostridia bacterium]|nr:sporulation integral membrane protein YtvI [Clostridia bacterium]
MQNRLYEKRRKFIVNVTYFALIVSLVFLFFKYAVVWLMPFIIGFILASIANPLVSKICGKTGINRRLCAFVVMLLEYFLIIFVVWVAIAKILGSAQAVFADLPRYFDENIVPFWNNFKITLTEISRDWPPEVLVHVSSFTDGAFESLRGLISGASEHFLSFITQTTGRIPFLFLSVVFAVLSSFFISMDYDEIRAWVKGHIPTRLVGVVSDTKLQLGKTLLKYVKAYSIILSITFVELIIGLMILRVENFLGIAAIIAVFDILPILGTGGIIIPWSLFSFASGNYFLGIGLLVLYLVIILVRNFAEPKIIGMQLGLHPLVTLLTIYVGYRFFGIIGMIGLPVMTTIFLALHKTGKLNIRMFLTNEAEDVETNNE